MKEDSEPEQPQVQVIKQFEVVRATTKDAAGSVKPILLIRLFIGDPATGQLLPSEQIAIHPADAVSLGQLLLHRAQQALGSPADLRETKH